MILLIPSLLIHFIKEALQVQFLNVNNYILLHYARHDIYINSYQRND